MADDSPLYGSWPDLHPHISTDNTMVAIHTRKLHRCPAFYSTVYGDCAVFWRLVVVVTALRAFLHVDR